MVRCRRAERTRPCRRIRGGCREYVDLIDSAVKPLSKKTRPKPRREDLLADLADALSTLYTRALHLPDLWDDAWTFDGEGVHRRGIRAAQTDIQQLSRRFERIDYYDTVVAFGTDAGEQHGHLLSDDLGDIYWDLQDGFDLLRAGSSECEAAYTWHWGFWNHWAEHVVNALRVIHARLPRASTLIGSEE